MGAPGDFELPLTPVADRALSFLAGRGRNSGVPGQGDVRAVLQYVPQFRGRVFVVLIEAGLLPEPAVAETLLDLAALQEVGVKLVLGVLGGDLEELYDWTVVCVL